MDIQKIKELALANGFSLKPQASGNMDLNAYVYDFANAVEREVKAQSDQKIKLLLCDEHLKKCESPTGIFNSQYPDEEPCLICLAKQYKAQAVPDLSELQERIAGHQYYHDEHGHMIVDMDDVVKEISGFDSWKAQAVPEKTVQLHLVWNQNKDECVGFLDSKDARYTATGDYRGMFGVTALGDYFRDLNDERDEFETQILMIEPQEPAND